MWGPAAYDVRGARSFCVREVVRGICQHNTWMVNTYLGGAGRWTSSSGGRRRTTGGLCRWLWLYHFVDCKWDETNELHCGFVGPICMGHTAVGAAVGAAEGAPVGCADGCFEGACEKRCA